MSSASVVIGALKVNRVGASNLILQFVKLIGQTDIELTVKKYFISHTIDNKT